METNITGGYDNRVSSARPKTCHSICVTARAVGHPSQVASFACEATVLCFPHSSLSPPFHHATACPTSTGRLQWPTRRSSDRQRAQTAPRVEERLDFRERTRYGLGVLHKERAPRKLGVGCETSRGKETPLTVSAFSLPQFTHIHSKIFLTFTMKPEIVLLE